jgi:hypothetical protein
MDTRIAMKAFDMRMKALGDRAEEVRMMNILTDRLEKGIGIQKVRMLTKGGATKWVMPNEQNDYLRKGYRYPDPK